MYGRRRGTVYVCDFFGEVIFNAIEENECLSLDIFVNGLLYTRRIHTHNV